MKSMQLNEKQKKIIYWVLFGILLLWIAFLGFYKLGVKYVDPWDEARHGINAYEMLKAGNPIKNTYLYETDLYNLKPPLSMWCQMLTFAIFGANSFTLRMYSVFCYLGLAVMVSLYLKKRFGMASSILALGFFAANTTPFAAHMVRSGDADSLYVLLFTASMICMLKLREKPRYLYLCGLFFALAFLTKSYHAAMIAVIGVAYLIFTGLWKQYKAKEYALFVGSVIGPIAVWAIPRMVMDGLLFFREMLLTDVLGRTDGTLQNNVQPFGWYAKYYLGAMSGKTQIYLWAFVIVLGGLIVMSMAFRREWLFEQKDELVGFGLWILVPFLGFSAVGNKLLWYLYPVSIPLFMAAAIIAGSVISMKTTPKVSRIICACLMGILLVTYSKDVFATVTNQTQENLNEFQNLIVETTKKVPYSGTKAFVIYEPNEEGISSKTWAQQDVYVAEAYGGYYCVNEEDYANGGAAAIVFASNLVASEVLPEDTKEIATSGQYTAYLVNFTNYNEREQSGTVDKLGIF